MNYNYNDYNHDRQRDGRQNDYRPASTAYQMPDGCIPPPVGPASTPYQMPDGWQQCKTSDRQAKPTKKKISPTKKKISPPKRDSGDMFFLSFFVWCIVSGIIALILYAN